VSHLGYCALRRRTTAAAWWSAARQRRDEAPAALLALLAGRTRVEVTGDEAAAALAWAQTVDGWSAAEPKPIFVHDPAASSATDLDPVHRSIT
jgi:hypothetical protein